MGNEVKDDAKKDVDDIKATYKKEGAEAATKKMHEELANNAGKDGRSAEQQKEYVAEMTKLMTEGDNPVLPKISEAWLSTHQELKNNNGLVTDDRLYMARELSNGDPLKQAFIDDLRKRYNEIRDKSSDYTDGISEGDIKEAIRQRDEKRTEENKAEDQKARNMERARVLLQDNGKLFNALDTAGWGGTADGYISVTDLQQFLKNEQTNRQLGYTGEQFKVVREMLDNWSYGNGGNYDTDAIDYSGWSGVYLTRQSLAKGLGYGEGADADIAKMQSDLTAKKSDRPDEQKPPQSKPTNSDAAVADKPPEAQEKDDKGRVKKVKFADGNTNEYEYDEEGRVIKMTETTKENTRKVYVRDGEKWKESSDGGATFTDSKVKDIKVDQSTNTLTIECSENGKDTVTTVDGTTGKKETREKAASEFSQEYAESIKQMPGKGFWHVAKAMLPEGTADTDARIKIIMEALKKLYIENGADEKYKRTGIPSGDKFLRYQFFKDAAALQKFVDELARAHPELKGALLERSKPKTKAA